MLVTHPHEQGWVALLRATDDELDAFLFPGQKVPQNDAQGRGEGIVTRLVG